MTTSAVPAAASLAVLDDPSEQGRFTPWVLAKAERSCCGMQFTTMAPPRQEIMDARHMVAGQGP